MINPNFSKYEFFLKLGSKLTIPIPGIKNIDKIG